MHSGEVTVSSLTPRYVQTRDIEKLTRLFSYVDVMYRIEVGQCNSKRKTVSQRFGTAEPRHNGQIFFSRLTKGWQQSGDLIVMKRV